MKRAPVGEPPRRGKRQHCTSLCDNGVSPEYFFENGQRCVKPYFHVFQANAKARWFGRTVLDVMLKEFSGKSKQYYQTAIEEGLILVNSCKVTDHQVFKENDVLTHRMHRHEPPVRGDPVRVLHDSHDLLAVCKPATMPVHPCGRYYFNSLVSILRHEHNYMSLHPLHRLDRLTSGVVVLAKSSAMASDMIARLRSVDVHKVYVAEVEGRLDHSGTLIIDEPIVEVPAKLGVCRCGPTGKPAVTRVRVLRATPRGTLLECTPLTGRTHQVRVHLQHAGHPIVEDPLYGRYAHPPSVQRALRGGEQGGDHGGLQPASAAAAAEGGDTGTGVTVMEEEEAEAARGAPAGEGEGEGEWCPHCAARVAVRGPVEQPLHLHARTYTWADHTFDAGCPPWLPADHEVQ